MSAIALDPAEDDAYLCVDRMQPELQKIINQHFRGEALICAMTTTFAGLLKERGGSDEAITRAVEAFAQLPAAVRKEVPDCHARIKNMIDNVQRDGFSQDAILWAMLGAIINLYRSFGFPELKIDGARDDMIMRINEARRLSTH